MAKREQQRRSPPGYRRIDGELWGRIASGATEKDARKKAQDLRDKGIRVRVIKLSTSAAKKADAFPVQERGRFTGRNQNPARLANGDYKPERWSIFIPRTRTLSRNALKRMYNRRHYNAETQRRGFFGFGRKKKVRTVAKKSKAQREFETIKAESDRRGITLTAAAEIVQQKQRSDKQMAAMAKRKAQIEKQDKEMELEADRKRWDRETEVYKQGAPPSLMLKYNSLEIVGGGAGLGIGIALAATVPWAIPLGIVGGIVAAKLIRIDRPWIFGVNPRRTVNATIDYVDYASESVLEALQTSKDEGKGLTIRRPARKKPKKKKGRKR